MTKKHLRGSFIARWCLIVGHSFTSFWREDEIGDIPLFSGTSPRCQGDRTRLELFSQLASVLYRLSEGGKERPEKLWQSGP